MKRAFKDGVDFEFGDRYTRSFPSFSFKRIVKLGGYLSERVQYHHVGVIRDVLDDDFHGTNSFRGSEGGRGEYSLDLS